MKRIIQLFAAILIYGIVTAQVCDDIPNNTTDPINPSDYRGNNEGYDNTPPNPPDPNYTPLLLNPFYNKLPDGSGPKFNWASPNFFEWHLAPGTSIPTVMIESPFSPTNHWDNVGHLKNNANFRDNKPVDGWELIVYGLGQDRQLNLQTSFSHPYVVLYNKHTGILRVFYYLKTSNFSRDYDAATIKLSFDESLKTTKSKQSANFNHMEEIARPLNNYVKNQNLQVPNTIYNGLNSSPGSGMWLQADFAMAYDPCVCEFVYDKMQIDVTVADEADVTLTGDISAKPITKDLGKTSGTANAGAAYKTGFKEVDKFASQAQKSYKKGEELTKFIGKVAGAKLPSKAKKDEQAISLAKDGLSQIAKLGKAVPYIGMAIGVVNLLIKEEDSPSKPSNTPISFDATVSLSGTITNQASSSPILFQVPGSDYKPYTSNPNATDPTIAESIPFYDEPLGVVSLVKTPRIEYQHNYAGDFDVPSGGFIGNHKDWEKLPRVTTYTIKDAPEIVVNPSSGLELVEAKISNVLEYVPFDSLKEHQNRLDMNWQPNHHFYATQFLNFPFVPGATLNMNNFNGTTASSAASSFNVFGWTHENWLLADNDRTNLELQDFGAFYKISYGQMPLGCYEGSKFNLVSNTRVDNGQDWVWEKPKVVVRINMTLKRPHADPTKGDVYYKIVQSYLVEEQFITESEEPAGNYSFDTDLNFTENKTAFNEWESWGGKMVFNPIVGGGAAAWANNYTNSPGAADFLVFEDEEIGPGRIEAWDKIIIRGNVDIKPGTELYAGTEIIVRPENTFYPEVTMKIGRSVHTQECASAPISNFTDPDLIDFCDQKTVQRYNPEVIRNKKDPEEKAEQEPEVKTYSFALYPNPTDELVNISVDVVDGATYTIHVLEITGRMVYSRTMSAAEFTNSTTTINTSSMESGMYFVTIREGTNTMTKRLVIVR